MKNYIKNLKETVRIKRDSSAIQFFETVLEEAKTASERFGVNVIYFFGDDDPYHDNNGFYKADDAYYVRYPNRINHELVVEKLEEVGFDVEVDNKGRIDEIYW